MNPLCLLAPTLSRVTASGHRPVCGDDCHSDHDTLDPPRIGPGHAVKDSLIAATALAHGLVVATRNRTDFQKAGVDVLDPFE